jgi:DNA mismatch repair protein MutL
MSNIRILPENVANKIAAGEVVERPASVVKELVENALDAGAKTVRIEVESGGKRLVQVTDDGSGMSHDDALLAFERHATSKLRAAEDLLSIATLGFRGEALPSVAAVSRLVLETRAAGEGQGTRVELAGGKLLSVKPAGVPVGTRVSAAELFYCVPARRKFLKSDTTELGHVASLVTHYALAHPDRQFLLRTPTQEIVNVAPVEQLSERVYQLLGRQALGELVEIAPVSAPMRAAITEAEMEPGREADEIVVRGFVSRPEVTRSNRNAIYLFVNRRLVRDRLLLHASSEAYRNIIPPNAFPVVLLFLELPYDEVDVNVHPAKIEVRFRHPQFIHDFARDAIRQALAHARPIASFPAAAASAGKIPQGGTARAAAGAEGPPRAVIPSGPLGTAVPLAEGFELAEAPAQPEAQRLGFLPGETIDIGMPPEEFARKFREAAARPAEGAPPVSPEVIGSLKPLGQVNNSFIVAVNADGLWIVDQHVAHERVLFEQHLEARRRGALAGQRLLVPIVVELSPRQHVILEQIDEELQANGFEAEPIGPRSVAIQAGPAGIDGGDVEKLLVEILAGIEREAQAISLESLQGKIAASTACHAAIKVNFPLDQRKMDWLLGELAKTQYPMSCPHGRPVLLRYSLRDIEKAFKRN